MNSKKNLVIFLFVFISFSILYTTNLDGWLIHDDEGTDFYEVWQMQKGKKPGIDFMAEQQPLYLMLGSTVINLFGRSAWHLRMSCTLQLLLGALALALAVYRIWGAGAATLTLGLLLSNSNLYYQARLFRPDTMMIAWELAALGAALLAVSEKRRRWWALAGICYGVGILSKPFGIFPLFGASLFFLDMFLHNRSSLKQAATSCAAFIIPIAVVGIGLNAWFYNQMGFYYSEVFGQHLELGQETTLFERFARTTIFYTFTILQHPILLLSLPLWTFNAKQNWKQNSTFRFLFYQLPIPIVFLAMKRPMFLRYLIFLIPVFVTLSAWQINNLLERWSRKNLIMKRFHIGIMVAIIATALTTTRPGITQSIFRHEDDTLKLAALVAENSEPEDIVISDYASINFYAARDSIYEASIIAGGRIGEQIITGKLLIERIEEQDVEMVLVHTAGGDPEPHQLLKLVDYGQFKEYLLEHFNLLTIFDRAGQMIDVYKRK